MFNEHLYGMSISTGTFYKHDKAPRQRPGGVGFFFFLGGWDGWKGRVIEEL